MANADGRVGNGGGNGGAGIAGLNLLPAFNRATGVTIQGNAAAGQAAQQIQLLQQMLGLAPNVIEGLLCEAKQQAAGTGALTPATGGAQPAISPGGGREC